MGIRLCCTWFVAIWIADLIAWPVGLARSILRPEVFPVALVMFLFVTGLQSLQTSAKLALFSNKLGIAILIAALIRVRGGLPAALNGFPSSEGVSALSNAEHGLSLLAFYVGPLLFLAADFGHRMQGCRQVAMTAGMGLVLPLFGTLLLVGVIGLATHASPYYQPSLQPTVAMALWSKVAGSALPGRMLIAAITTFGAVRFGAGALMNSVLPASLGRRLSRVVLGCLCGIVGWCSLHHFDSNLIMSFEVSAGCLTAVAAVLTAGFVCGKYAVPRVRRVDFAGLSALGAGLATWSFMRSWVADDWWEPGLFPSYIVAFATCVVARALHRSDQPYTGEPLSCQPRQL